MNHDNQVSIACILNVVWQPTILCVSSIRIKAANHRIQPVHTPRPIPTSPLNLTPPLIPLTMSPHPPRPAPNIALRLLRRVLFHIPPEPLQPALFGFHPRNANAFCHLAADGFGLARRAHGWVGVVRWGWVGGFRGAVGEELCECCFGVWLVWLFGGGLVGLVNGLFGMAVEGLSSV